MKIILEIDSIVLRQFTEDDLEPLNRLNNEPEILRWQPGSKCDRAKVQQDIEKYLSQYKKYKEYGVWAAVLKSSGELVGRFMFIPHSQQPWFNPELCNPDDVEIGFLLKSRFWGKGLATKIAQILVDKGFNNDGVPGVIGFCFSDNTRSIRVMEKLGMKEDKKFLLNQPDAKDKPQPEVVIYRISREEYFKKL